MACNGGRAALAVVAALVVAVSACGSEDAASDTTAVEEPGGVTTAGEAPATSDPDAPPPSLPPTTVPATTAPETAAGPSTEAAAGGDECGRLEGVDLDALLGEPAGDRVPEADGFGSGCLVSALDPESRGRVSLRVTQQSPAENYENLRDQSAGAVDVDGLGEQAFAAPAIVVVLAGDELVSLQAVRERDLGLEGVSQDQLVSAVTAVVGGTGAPTGDTAAPAGSAPTGASGLACELLADVDLDALLGEPMGDLVSEDQGGSDSCTVDPVDPASTAVVNLTLLDGDVAQRLEESREMFGVDSVVEGIGDEGFHSGPVLAVRAGSQGFLLYVLGDVMLGADIDDAELEALMAQFVAAAG